RPGDFGEHRRARLLGDDPVVGGAPQACDQHDRRRSGAAAFEKEPAAAADIDEAVEVGLRRCHRRRGGEGEEEGSKKAMAALHHETGILWLAEPSLAAAPYRFASEGWWAQQDSNLRPAD